jgi:serine/threonine protein phosphatase PrpC
LIFTAGKEVRDQILKEGFEMSQYQLATQDAFDVTLSGSTSVIVFMNNDKIICANVGDSRAVIGELKKNKKWNTIPLSHDHKPDLSGEYERIIG